jgi:hypothetical protein
VQAAASELEHACKEKVETPRIDALLEKTLAALAPVLAGLRQLAPAPEHSAPPSQPAPPGAEIDARLEHLRQLLADSDAEAADAVAALMDTLAGSELGARLRPVATAIEDFDFDAALERLAGVKQP